MFIKLLFTSFLQWNHAVNGTSARAENFSTSLFGTSPFLSNIFVKLKPVYTTAYFGYGTDKNGTGAKKKSSARINF